jgi:2EXR family
VAVTLKVFTCFPNLPKELRLKIWRHAAFIPRDVSLCVGSWNLEKINSGVSNSLPLTPHYFFGMSRPPTILSTCHESRKVELCHYNLCFGTEAKYEHPQITISKAPNIYHNPDVDKICFMNAEELCNIDHEARIAILCDLVRECCMKKVQFFAYNMTSLATVKLLDNGGLPFEIVDYFMEFMKGLHFIKEIKLFVPAKLLANASPFDDSRIRIILLEAKDSIL